MMKEAKKENIVITSVRLPKSLDLIIKKLGKETYRNRTSMINVLLREAIEARGLGEALAELEEEFK